MTILIINNYYEKETLTRVNRISDALGKAGKKKHELWNFSEVNEKKIPDDVEAIILSGSTAHLQKKDHESMYRAEIELVRRVEVPLLGICFGHQLIGKAFGSQIYALPQFIGRPVSVKILVPDEIFSLWEKGDEITLPQPHRDFIANLPDDFLCLAESESCKIEAIEHKDKPIYGVQAHVERASDENPDGWQVLKNFISNVVGCGGTS